MPEAKRRLRNFNFNTEDAHLAIVDKAANGTEFFLFKAFADSEKFDNESGEFVPREESGLKVNMTLEDMLMLLTDMWPEDVEMLTSSIAKAADGPELITLLKDEMPGDLFAARREEFENKLTDTNAEGMTVFRAVADLINDFFNRGIKPGDSDSMVPNLDNLVEKSDMSDKDKTPATPDEDKVTKNSEDKTTVEEVTVSKADFDAQSETVRKQAAVIEALQKAEDRRVTESFVAKAKGFSELGLPEVGEGVDQATDFGLALKALAAADADAYAKVESVLTKALDTITKGEFLSPIGDDGEPEVVSKSSDDAIQKAAQALMKEDKTLTESQAVVKALDENPDLYDGGV